METIILRKSFTYFLQKEEISRQKHKYKTINKNKKTEDYSL